MAAYQPMRRGGLYHTAKVGIQSLGNALYAEYRRQGIDILVTHPAMTSGTKFYAHDGIK